MRTIAIAVGIILTIGGVSLWFFGKLISDMAGPGPRKESGAPMGGSDPTYFDQGPMKHH